METSEPFLNSWPKLDENRIRNPKKNSPSLCGVYDIVIPTDSTVGFDSESSEQIQTKLRCNSINSGATEDSLPSRNKLRRCACNRWSCRESLSKSSLPKDSSFQKLDLRRTRLPAISTDTKHTLGTPVLFTQRQISLSKVSLPKNSSRRDLLGIHLTPQVPELATHGDLSDRNRTQIIPKRVSMRKPLDVKIQSEESLSPGANDRFLVSLDPDIRTSSCMLHPKNDQPSRDKTLMYSTNRHGSVYTQYQKRNRVVKKPIFQAIRKSYFEKESTRDNYPLVRRLPVLPRELHADEFVATWLVHGSAPSGEPHFPDITS